MSGRLTSLIDRFIYPGDKLSPDNYRKGRFFIVSTCIFLLLAILGFVFMVAKYGSKDSSLAIIIPNAIIALFPIGPFLIYRKWGRRILLVNCLTAIAYISNFAVYENGGIFDIENVWGIILSAWVFLVADKKSGIFWFIMTAAFYIFLFVASLNGWRDFRTDSMRFDGTDFFINLFLAACFLCVIIILHEGGKEKYLKELIDAKQELEKQKKITDQRNKDITDSIRYAEKIQRARIATEKYIDRNLRRLNKC